MKTTIAAVLIAISAGAAPAFAEAPGESDEVYGARIEPWVFELEGRYHSLEGGPEGGENMLKVEAAYGVSSKLRLAVTGEFEKPLGDIRRANEIGIEAIYSLGSIGPIDVAVYGEYAIGLRDNPDSVEGKVLLEYQRGTFDARLNLIADKALAANQPVDFGYSYQIDKEAIGTLRLGVQGFGNLGTLDNSFPAEEHFMGPSISANILGFGHRPMLDVSAGYLFALGKTRANTDGQFRFAVEFEF
jgi:hypothetical protein